LRWVSVSPISICLVPSFTYTMDLLYISPRDLDIIENHPNLTCNLLLLYMTYLGEQLEEGFQFTKFFLDSLDCINPICKYKEKKVHIKLYIRGKHLHGENNNLEKVKETLTKKL